jgi:arylformamidase
MMAPPVAIAETPPIYAGLTQAELDRAYDQDCWAPNAADIQARIMARSRWIAEQIPPESVRYGAAEEQVIDIFAPPDASGVPVFLFIHGGAWRLSMRAAFYSPAPAIVAAGCILAIAGFQCLPSVTLPQMAGQVRQAILHLARNAASFGGDPGNLQLVGHSSGAHLAAVALAGDLGPAAPGLRGATLISGLYDLEPVMLSSRRAHITLAPDEVAALSPILRADAFRIAVSLWCGSLDSPEFRRQSQAFADALGAAGRLRRSEVIEDLNHFEMLELLGDPDGPILASLVAAADRRTRPC